MFGASAWSILSFVDQTNSRMNSTRLLIGLLGIAVLTCSDFARTAAAEPSPRIVAAMAAVRDDARPEKERLIAIRRLGAGEYDVVAESLFQLLDPAQRDSLRVAVVQAFQELAQPRSVTPLLTNWSRYSAVVKQQVFRTLTGRRELAGEFVAQLETGRLALSELDTATRERLINFPDDALAERAKKLLAREPLLDARKAYERFASALAFKGDAKRGLSVFKERTCVNCHRLSGEGVFVGADLYTVKDMPRDELLRNIVAPNLFFMPNFQAFVAETEDGELVEGVMAGSTETTVTLRRALGEDSVLKKSSLKKLKGLNVSLMPEGLLEGLTPQQVADLLEFIRSAE